MEAFRLPEFAEMLTLIFVRYAGLLFQTQILPRKNQTFIHFGSIFANHLLILSERLTSKVQNTP